jgi:hypothetical protein
MPAVSLQRRAQGVALELALHPRHDLGVETGENSGDSTIVGEFNSETVPLPAPYLAT